MIINKEKFSIFLDVARRLNQHSVTPILFGSLGLNRLISEFREAHDIDILVPNSFFKNEWLIIEKIMKEMNFVLYNKEEHEFINNENIVAFAPENDLTKLTKINPENLKISQFDETRFKELTPQQYLLCYQLMLRDDYRQEKRGNADKEKIKLIENYLASKSNK